MQVSGRADHTIRVYAERSDAGSTELALAFDELREGDVTIAQPGLTLVADPQTVSIAEHRAIDYGTDGFTFTVNPGCESHLFNE